MKIPNLQTKNIKTSVPSYLLKSLLNSCTFFFVDSKKSNTTSNNVSFTISKESPFASYFLLLLF